MALVLGRLAGRCLRTLATAGSSSSSSSSGNGVAILGGRGATWHWTPRASYAVPQTTKGLPGEVYRVKPRTGGTRMRFAMNRDHLHKGRPDLKLCKGRGGQHLAGRDRKTGRITTRHRCAGAKRLYRMVDFTKASLRQTMEAEFKVSQQTMPETLSKQMETGALDRRVVVRLEYDPNRSAEIALVECPVTKERSYILAPLGLKPGDTLYYTMEGGDASRKLQVGNVARLRDLDAGTIVHNVEFEPGKGGRAARAAGAFVEVLATTSKTHARVRMTSGEIRYLPLDCRASIGSIGNINHKHIRLGTAGRARHKGWRPTVRGVAMNPVDHPHGGGGGRSKGGHAPQTPWGKLSDGVKTVTRKVKRERQRDR